jgi:hypothetical protein
MRGSASRGGEALLGVVQDFEGTRLHCIHGEGDLRGVWLQRGPVGDGEDKDGDAAGGEILLVAQVLVGGDEEGEVG